MVGAKQGWREAPYVACPAGLADIAAASVAIPTTFGEVRLAPGARASTPPARPT